MQFAVNVLRLIDRFPKTVAGYVVARQLAKSATSTAANYRAACNARSRAEFIAKLGVVVEEIDESEGWLDMSGRVPILPAEVLAPARSEAIELRAIFARSAGTARTNHRGVSKRPARQMTR